MKTASILFLGLTFTALAGLPSESHHDALGPLFNAAPHAFPNARHGKKVEVDAIRRWNEIAINASGLDHTPVAPGENRIFGEQLGPCRSSRAMAIVHIAMFDALNAVVRQYKSYTGVRAPRGPISLNAAISEAAHDTLSVLFHSQQARFDALLAEDFDQIKNKKAKVNGITLGRQAAAAILALRIQDGSQNPEPRVGVDFITSDLPGYWRQDPIS